MSLRVKLMVAFVAIGLLVLLVSSWAYYVSFERLAYEKLEGELREDATEFAETVDVENGIVRVRDHYEWEDVDEEYVVATDAQFQTVRKSENVGNLELQTLHVFQPVSAPHAVFFDVGGVEVMCVVSPVERDRTIVAYILIAASVERVAEYVDILKESILIALVFLVLFGMGAAYVFANRMMKPVLSIREAVGKINLERLDGRIELVQADSEMQSLVETLNGLFERLEKSYNQINDFSSNVAHELYTPLTILRGNIEVALNREREREEYVEILSDLQAETLHMIHVVDGLLLLARSDTSSLSIALSAIDLKAFCEEQVRDWDMVCLLKNQTLTYDIKGDFSISGDQSLLSQLFLNLISNASKYSGEGQAVEVDIEAQNGAVQIAIKDRGVGISGAEQGKVFERFYRVEKDRSRETGGVGLGLAICETIVKLHGGKISIKSDLGVGTTVLVILPIAIRNTEQVVPI